MIVKLHLPGLSVNDSEGNNTWLTPGDHFCSMPPPGSRLPRMEEEDPEGEGGLHRLIQATFPLYVGVWYGIRLRLQDI